MRATSTMRRLALTTVCVLAFGAASDAAESEPKAKGAKGEAGTKSKAPEKKVDPREELYGGLALRSIGPAVTSGRIVDLAVDPTDSTRFFVAVAAGGVWRTENAGVTFEPVFDGEGSFAIGSVAIAPSDPMVVWVGTGENNVQRVAAYGDGVYKSIDGGTSFETMGLETSEHIGKILIDPRDPNTVWVAAQGPAWSAGGDRGLYKTTDGGVTWTKVLEISEHTGVTDIAFDPRNPDVIYATAYERHRRVWTLIGGGPGSGLHKSLDGGKTWTKLTVGLPKEDLGRIGIAISPVDPDYVYALVEAAGKTGGAFRSTDGGASFEKLSDYQPAGGQYYQELVADPKLLDRVYSMDTFMQVTNDGGKTWRRAGERYKHVDNHALWIDPDDTDHLLVGCDGGLYESFDRATTWNFKANLPITQFYRVAVDNALPFYNVYGGTQDNNSLGGPSRTDNLHGIRNSDWFVTQGGDGFQSQVDPEDPNTVYAEAQYGELDRFDRATGERVQIQPQPAAGDDAQRWNWDSPLIISPHSHTRLYVASQRLWRSDDRGDSWRAVSPDLTRRIDRNRLQVANRVWSVDAVAKNASTSFYGNLVSIAESPRQEGLLYLGTDDGLVQVSEDDGAHWRRTEKFPGVPDRTYVSRLSASEHDAATVYVSFDNHQNGDFKPYVLRSTDRGRTWTSIASNLPARSGAWSVAQDHVNGDLIFAGLEFGVWVTVDGGAGWVQLEGGMPTAQARDLAIHRRAADLVVGTFGRGVYILDDYSPLRELTREALAADAALLPLRDVYLFDVLGQQQAALGNVATPNPPVGAVFTYTAARAPAAGAALVLTIADDGGRQVRRLTLTARPGVNRVTWDLRGDPPRAEDGDDNAGRTAAAADTGGFPGVDQVREAPQGPPAGPGRYVATLGVQTGDTVAPIGRPRSFSVIPLPR